MKYLIVGLGNPGPEYVNTRHNVGFAVLDRLVEAAETRFSDGRLGWTATVKHRGRSLVLLKPATYMNLSGKAVNYWMQQEKIPLERVMVITDDLALPFGKLRLRGKGSDGGHNGLKDIARVLGRQDYARLRFGVGAEFSKGKQVDYVLGEWSADEAKTLQERIELAADCARAFASIGVARAMNEFNSK